MKCDVELLVVQKEDFERILKPIMTQQYMAKKSAIKALEYFDFFTQEQLVVAYKLGILRQFDPLETIYYEDKGLASYVYFVISGECMVLQCLKIKKKIQNEKKTYELIDTSQDDSINFMEDMTEKEIMKMLLEEKLALQSLQSESNEDEKDIRTSTKIPERKVINMSAEVICSSKNFNIRQQEISNSISIEKLTEETQTNTASDIKLCYEGNIFDSASEFLTLTEDFSISGVENGFDNSTAETKLHNLGNNKESVQLINDPTKKFKKRSSISINKNSSNLVSKSEIAQNDNSKKETRFVDVGSITFGGIFGLGEKFENRFIMARTSVQCLMLPRFWLLEKDQNIGNIWQRRRFYLDCTIPSRIILFRNFLATLKWQKYKKELIEKRVYTKSTANSTKKHDIPIICKITDDD